jgi:hypothetical protein
MKIVIFHDAMNPDQILPMDAEDFSAAWPQPNGSAVRLKSSDTCLLVHETTTEVLKIITEVLS